MAAPLENVEARIARKAEDILALLRATTPQKLRTLKPLDQLKQELIKKLTGPKEPPAHPSVGPLTETERGALNSGGFHLDRTFPRRGKSEFEQLVEHSLNVEAAATRLGVNASRIRQRLIAGTLYGFKRGGRWVLPRFQFARRSIVSGLENVLPAIQNLTLHPVAIQRWFLTPQSDLSVDNGAPMTPLEWLREGHPPADLTALLRSL